MADDQQFLTDIKSNSADVRFAAWRRAGEVSPAVIPELGKQAGSSDPGMAKAGREALATIVHSVGRSPLAANWAAVVKGLVTLAGPDSAPSVRVHAIRLLSNIAGEETVPAIASWIQVPELAEEVVFCLERIPGRASDRALIGAYKEAKSEFKPRILAALGHRRSAEALALTLEAMRSPDKEIAVAGAKAFGRIGRRPTSSPQYPETQTFSEWQKIDQSDSVLRYADALVKLGNVAEAMSIYKAALDRPEDHWQCAAVIGLAKIGTAQAAAMILPKLKSDNPKVRISAANAWKGMAAEKIQSSMP
jgi:tetratricopeptide (TPR) repeat protein